MSATWVLSRATGVVSLLLLTLVVVLGVAVNRQARLPGLPRFAVADLHRNAALLSVSLLAVHVATVVYDPYVTVRWVDALVPFASSYRPFWLGLGALALDLLLAVVLTSLLRLSMPRRTWRSVHWLAYAAWPVAVVHGLGTGPDLRAGSFLLLTVGCVAAVLTAVGWRVRAAARAIPAGQRAAALLATLRHPPKRAGTRPPAPLSRTR